MLTAQIGSNSSPQLGFGADITDLPIRILAGQQMFRHTNLIWSHGKSLEETKVKLAGYFVNFTLHFLIIISSI